METTFAIVTPSYNKARYLRRCLASVLDQNFPGVDYWLLDNCSNDGSGEIIAEFRNLYPERLKILVEKDSGQAAAINHGFSLAKGEIMAWLNADDFYLPNTFELVAKYFREHPEIDLIYGRASIVDGDYRQVGTFPVQPHNLSVLKSYDYIPQPSAFWRRRLWDKIGPLDSNLNWGLDWEFFIRASKMGKVAFVDDYLSEVVADGQTKTATGGLGKTRELARISRNHGGWFQPTNLFCHYVLCLHWLARPWSKKPGTEKVLDRLQSYMVTLLFRLFKVQVMS